MKREHISQDPELHVDKKFKIEMKKRDQYWKKMLKKRNEDSDQDQDDNENFG